MSFLTLQDTVKRDVCKCVFLQGHIIDLKLLGNPRAAERLCDDEDDTDNVRVCF